MVSRNKHILFQNIPNSTVAHTKFFFFSNRSARVYTQIESKELGIFRPLLDMIH